MIDMNKRERVKLINEILNEILNKVMALSCCEDIVSEHNKRLEVQYTNKNITKDSSIDVLIKEQKRALHYSSEIRNRACKDFNSNNMDTDLINKKVFREKLNNLKSIYDTFTYLKNRNYCNDIEELKESFMEQYLEKWDLNDILGDENSSIEELKYMFEEFKDNTENDRSIKCLDDEIEFLDKIVEEIRNFSGKEKFSEHIFNVVDILKKKLRVI